tara:strand:- start:2969 stop:3868 length:900 start_codon:yes stop_codon:yes gene_type:complete
MPDLHLYLPHPMRENAAKGEINIINRIGIAVAQSGYGMQFHGDSVDERMQAIGDDDLHLFYMQEPYGQNVLNLRRAYTYPFWQIEATNERWNFDVAKAAFDPSEIDMEQARPFFRRWRKRLLGDAPRSEDGYVFMPLQGRLRVHRSFQSMSPEAMIQMTLAMEPRHGILATLHPNEAYDDEDFAMLETFSARHPRFKVIEGNARDLVLNCKYVATQNSSVAMHGYFAKKPAVLFADIDFHHIAGAVGRLGLEKAFAMTEENIPFVAYLYWFFKNHCINGGAPEAEAQILARMRAHNWPV